MNETNNRYYRLSNGIVIEHYTHAVLGDMFCLLNIEGRRQSVKADKWMIEDVINGVATEIENPVSLKSEKTISVKTEELATVKQKNLMDSLNVCYPENITKKYASFLISDALGN